MSSIQVAKSLMQFAGKAPEPQQCQTCKHGSSACQERAGRYYCDKGGFFVAAVAGCKEWMAKAEQVAV